MLHFGLFAASVSKTRPKVQTLFISVLLLVCVCVDLGFTFYSVSFYWLFIRSRNTQNVLPYKLMVVACSLYAIFAYERFHRNALLFDSGGNLYIVLQLELTSVVTIYITVLIYLEMNNLLGMLLENCI